MKTAKPKLTVLAETLNVSVATVSNALSGKGRISPELAEKIRRMADDMGYVPSSAGRALRTGRSGVLGLVLPDIANPLFPQIAQAIEGAASARDYGVLIGDSHGRAKGQADAVSRLIERGVDGLIVIPRRGTQIGEVACPIAVIDSPSTPGNTVSADHFDGGVQMGHHLAALGHARVLILATSADSQVQAQRIAGLVAGLTAVLGKAAEVATVFIDALEQRRGQGCALDLVPWVERGFTAVAALSDLTALRALTELQGAGLCVPQMVSVTGFDDLVWSGVVTPALTTMRMNMAEIARLAIEALVTRIEEGGNLQAHAGPVQSQKDRVAMTLVVRASSGPARTAAMDAGEVL